MRAEVDSSDSDDPALDVLARALELLRAGRIGDEALELGGDTASASARFSGRVPTYRPTWPVLA